MSDVFPTSALVPDRLAEVWSGWNRWGQQWFVEVFVSDEDSRLFKYTINDANRDYTEHLFHDDAKDNRTFADQLVDDIFRRLRDERGYERRRGRPSSSRSIPSHRNRSGDT